MGLYNFIMLYFFSWYALFGYTELKFCVNEVYTNINLHLLYCMHA